MITTSRITEARKICDAERSDGARVGFVPTMGALHEGHRSLIRRARTETSFVVVSIFVNPTQFGPHEDLAAYPRTLEADLRVCEEDGVGLVFHPDADEMYPSPPSTIVHVEGLAQTMEGAVRPEHFDGVAQVCTKLFNVVGPCSAYFGEKDAQQLRVVRRVVADLDLPVEVIGCPTVRDEDGLALSSRNAYLSPEERTRALALPRALRAVHGSRDAQAVVSHIRREIEAGGVDEIDYVEVVDPQTLEPVEVIAAPVLVCVAVRVGRTRLIDNVWVEPR